MRPSPRVPLVALLLSSVLGGVAAQTQLRDPSTEIQNATLRQARNNTAPAAGFQGVGYTDGMFTGKNVTYADADEAVLSADTSEGGACSSSGFKCDFTEQAHDELGEYTPLDFHWSVVDPLDYDKDKLDMSTLPCTLPISLDENYALQNTTATGVNGTSMAAITNVTQSNYWFYVGRGHANRGDKSADYCDLEAVRKAVNSANQDMTDSIRLRAETARIDSSSFTSLVGLSFDLICSCSINLDVESDLQISQDATAMLLRMKATDQERSMRIQLRLYSDDLLEEEYNYMYQNFPASAPAFYFLTRHESDEDWDAHLQMNKCAACSNEEAECTTRKNVPGVIIFYDKCDSIVGGPRLRTVSQESWYHDPTKPTKWKPNGQWALGSPLTCPYHAVGFTKFRLAGVQIMNVVCAVTACPRRPCPPCSLRRLREEGFFLSTATTSVGRWTKAPHRRLQGDTEGFDEQELTQTFRFSPTDWSGDKLDPAPTEVEDLSDKKKGFPWWLILLLIAAIILMLWMKKMREWMQKKKDPLRVENIPEELMQAAAVATGAAPPPPPAEDDGSSDGSDDNKDSQDKKSTRSSDEESSSDEEESDDSNSIAETVMTSEAGADSQQKGSDESSLDDFNSRADAESTYQAELEEDDDFDIGSLDSEELIASLAARSEAGGASMAGSMAGSARTRSLAGTASVTGSVATSGTRSETGTRSVTTDTTSLTGTMISDSFASSMLDDEE